MIAEPTKSMFGNNISRMCCRIIETIWAKFFMITFNSRQKNFKDKKVTLDLICLPLGKSRVTLFQRLRVEAI